MLKNWKHYPVITIYQINTPDECRVILQNKQCHTAMEIMILAYAHKAERRLNMYESTLTLRLYTKNLSDFLTVIRNKNQEAEERNRQNNGVSKLCESKKKPTKKTNTFSKYTFLQKTTIRSKKKGLGLLGCLPRRTIIVTVTVKIS